MSMQVAQCYSYCGATQYQTDTEASTVNKISGLLCVFEASNRQILDL